MPILPEQIYDNKPCNPLYDGALLDDVALPAGVQYVCGQLLAAVEGSGTAVNDVQTFTITGTPTTGTFAIFWAGQFVGTGVYNSTALQLKTVLEAYFGVGNVDTSGGALPGTPILVTFKSESGGLFQPLMTNVDALGGGTNPALTITHTTPGKPAGGYFIKYADGVNDPARRVLRYASATDHRGLITNGNAVQTAFVPAQRGAPAYFRGIFKAADLIGLDANAVVDLGKLINGTAYNSANAIVSVL